MFFFQSIVDDGFLRLTNMAFGIILQGTSSGVATSAIVPEKLLASKENRGGGLWDLCENKHGWSSIS